MILLLETGPAMHDVVRRLVERRAPHLAAVAAAEQWADPSSCPLLLLSSSPSAPGADELPGVPLVDGRAGRAGALAAVAAGDVQNSPVLGGGVVDVRQVRSAHTMSIG
jgi:hypothetical protein